MKELINIYVLVDPRTDLPRYVGKTKHTAEKRLRSHIWDAVSKPRYPVHRWIRQLKSLGLKPIPYILEKVELYDEWVGAERHWISCLREQGYVLLNLNRGGGGPATHSSATRRKLSEAALGRRHIEEARRKISDSLKERYRDPEVKRQMIERTTAAIRKAAPCMSEFQKQRYSDPEERLKQSKRMKEVLRDPKIREKISRAGMGRVFSQETKDKMAEKANQRYADPEFRKKHKESVNTPEAKAKKGAKITKSWDDPEIRARRCKGISESRRGRRFKEIFLTVDGVTKSVDEWSKETGMPYRRIVKRHLKGWNDKDAVLSPRYPTNRKRDVL